MADFFNSKLYKREYECKEKTDIISIEASTDNIYVTGGNVGNVRISYMECPGKHEYELSEQNGKLSLVRKHIVSILWMIYSPFLDNAIKVTVPQGFTGAIEIKTATSNTVISNLTTCNLNVESGTGSVKVSNISSGYDIRIANSTGAITIENASVPHDICIGNSTGHIKLDKVAVGGSADISNTTGGIRLDSLKTGGNISLSTVSGAIKATIIGNANDYSVNTHTRTGSDKTTNSSGGSKMLNADSTTGSIRIVFTS